MSEELPTVLVIGATSKIGQPFVEELAKQTSKRDVRVIAAPSDFITMHKEFLRY